MVEAIFGIVLLMLASFFVWVFRVLKAGRPVEAVIIAFAALFFAVAGVGLLVDSCRTRMHERIAIEHKGHEAMHAQIEAGLMTAKPGDILEMPDGTRMFFVSGDSSEVGTRRINSEVSERFYIDRLVLDHARVLKLGTPEYATALVAEAEKAFGSLRRPEARR